MLKQFAVLEVRRGDKIYSLHLPSEAALGEVHDVLFEMRSFVIDKINVAVEADKPKKLETEAKSE